MKCINCGAELVAGNNTCPSCGALNMAFGQVTPINTGEESAVTFNTTSISVQNVTNETPAVQSEPVNIVDDKQQMVQEQTVAQPVQAASVQPATSAQPVIPEQPVQPVVPATPVVQKTEPVEQVQTTEEKKPSIYDTLVPVQQVVKKEHNIFDDDDVDDLESVQQVDANIAPPTLEVNKENLTEGVTDISAAGQSASTYETEPVEETPMTQEIVQEDKGDSVDISIPQVSAPVDKTNVPVDGSAPDMVTQTTVGTETKPEDLEEKIEVAHKSHHLRISMSGKNSLPIPIVIVGLVLFLLMGLGLGSVLFSKNYCSVASNKTTVSKQTVADGKNNVTKAGNYTYKIPDNYNYDRYEEGIFIFDSNDTYRLYIKDYDGLYEDLANSKSSIKSTLVEQGIAINGIKEMKVNDKNYILIEANNGMYNSLIGFTDAGDDKVFYFEIIDQSNNYNYDALDIVEDITTNAVLGEELSSMEKIDIVDVADITILTAKKYQSEYGN